LNLQVAQVGHQKQGGQPAKHINRAKEFLPYFGWIKPTQAGPLP